MEKTIFHLEFYSFYTKNGVFLWFLELFTLISIYRRLLLLTKNAKHISKNTAPKKNINTWKNKKHAPLGGLRSTWGARPPKHICKQLAQIVNHMKIYVPYKAPPTLNHLHARGLSRMASLL